MCPSRQATAIAIGMLVKSMQDHERDCAECQCELAAKLMSSGRAHEGVSVLEELEKKRAAKGGN